MDEADRTLDSILESTEEASARIRRVLDQSRLERSIRKDTSPNPAKDLSGRSSIEGSPKKEIEMSVWGEESFFRRIAKKAPGGWAFTPQPKLGRIIHIATEPTDQPIEVKTFKLRLRLGQRRRQMVGILANETEASNPN